MSDAGALCNYTCKIFSSALLIMQIDFTPDFSHFNFCSHVADFRVQRVSVACCAHYPTLR